MKMDIGDWLMVWLVGFITVMFLVFAWAIIHETQTPTFTLQKADWACTQAHTQQCGKTTCTVCDQYGRIVGN
jgi:hypothetical protein